MGKTSRRKDKQTAINRNSEVTDDWIAALAKKERLHELSTGTAELSKAARIAKRQAKKVLREERKTNTLVKTGIKKGGNAQELPHGRISSNKLAPPAVSTNVNNARLGLISQKISDRTSFYKETRGASWKKPYTATPVKMASSKRKRTRDIDDEIQPRTCDYGGIGLARPSLWIQLDDPSCTPRLEQEFQEHIPGFFGKHRTKAMKKQLDGKMLWRQLQNNKTGTNNALMKMVNGKKLADMTPDERFEAMIKAGMV